MISGQPTGSQIKDAQDHGDDDLLPLDYIIIEHCAKWVAGLSKRTGDHEDRKFIYQVQKYPRQFRCATRHADGDCVMQEE